MAHPNPAHHQFHTDRDVSLGGPRVAACGPSQRGRLPRVYGGRPADGRAHQRRAAPRSLGLTQDRGRAM